MASSLPDEAADLFAVASEEFVAARDALVKELQKAGKPEEAKAVKQLRKPPLGVWAVNQSARRRPDLVKRMAEVSGVMRAAGSSAQLREASTQRQAVIRQLGGEAAAALAEHGHPSSGQIVDKITRTLLAVSADPGALEVFARGVLEKEMEPELDFGFSLPEGTEPDGASSPGAQRARAKADQIDKEVKELEAETAELEREAKAAEDRVQLAKMEAERMAKRLETARNRLAKAREAKAKLEENG